MISLATTASIVKAAYVVAVFIRDSEEKNVELKRMAQDMALDLSVVGGVIDQLRNMTHRVTVTDEDALKKHINSLEIVATETRKMLVDVQRDRNFFQRLCLRTDNYRQKLRTTKEDLDQLCAKIQSGTLAVNKISIPIRGFVDFKRLFQHMPEKTLSVYDFFIIHDKPNSVCDLFITHDIPNSVSDFFIIHDQPKSDATINIDEFDNNTSCYMKLGQEHIIFSNKTQTCTSPIPKSVILEQRLPPPSSRLAQNELNERLGFTECFMSHDNVCGIALTKTLIYIATKHVVTIVSLTDQKIIAQYGSEGDDDRRFKHISHLYIPFDNEDNLYIVDVGQSAIHYYKINNEGTRFEFIRRYVVIANVTELPNLVACVIYTGKLFVSDDANNCLHVFNLQADRQAFYLKDNAITSFSPGSLCAHDKYLYVANCSSETSSIVIFDEDCNPVDWFRNKLFGQILAIDICPNLNELFILTTTNYSNNTLSKQTMIVTTDLCIRSE